MMLNTTFLFIFRECNVGYMYEIFIIVPLLTLHFCLFTVSVDLINAVIFAALFCWDVGLVKPRL